MAAPKRRARMPGTYFVTSRTLQGRALFVKQRPCEIFAATLFAYRARQAFLLHAFVLMPDHFQVMLTPAGHLTLERAVQYIKGGSAHRIGKELGLSFPVWQRGFSDHRVRDAVDYATHLQYIDQNPVKRKLVSAAGEYEWSSASGRFALDERPQGLKPPASTAPPGTAEAVP